MNDFSFIEYMQTDHYMEKWVPLRNKLSFIYGSVLQIPGNVYAPLFDQHMADYLKQQEDEKMGLSTGT